MRKQYHPMQSEEGLLVWDVDRLVRLAEDLPTRNVPLSSIWELDKVRWFGDGESWPSSSTSILNPITSTCASKTFPTNRMARLRDTEARWMLAKDVESRRMSIHQ